MPVESGTHQFPGNIAFAPALLDPDLDVPAGMVGPDGKSAPKRFSVYRNNVVVSLMEALAETYPSLKRLVGEDNFATLSRIYISAHPPSSAMMQAYGDQMPEFLQSFQPLQHSPFLVEVAKVEKYWIHAYHAADQSPLEGTSLAQIEPDKLMETGFTTHPATKLVSSNHALFELFHARTSPPDTQFDFAKKEQTRAVLITRPHLQVQVTDLDPAQAIFFQSLVSANTLGEAVELTMQQNQEFDASSAITLMLQTGTFSNISNDTNQ